MAKRKPTFKKRSDLITVQEFDAFVSAVEAAPKKNGLLSSETVAILRKMEEGRLDA